MDGAELASACKDTSKNIPERKLAGLAHAPPRANSGRLGSCGKVAARLDRVTTHVASMYNDITTTNYPTRRRSNPTLVENVCTKVRPPTGPISPLAKKPASSNDGPSASDSTPSAP